MSKFLLRSEMKENSSKGKKFERKKLRAPLGHPKYQPSNHFVLVDISLFPYHKETGHLDGGNVKVNIDTTRE